jgi:uncharacterized protein (DUF1684 family)
MSRLGAFRIGVVADDFLGEWEAFRAAREERLTSPHGFLSIAGLHWLDATPQRYRGVPGAWWLGPDGVVVELGHDEVLTIDGREIRGHELLGPVDEVGVRATAGDVEIEVAGRGDAILLRPRDPTNTLRTRHRPTPTFPPSPDWILDATFHELDGEKPIEDAIGEVAFTVAGEPVRLVAYDDDGGLWLVFADATSGRRTYGAGRQLYLPGPAPDGSVVLDFNRTINLPCAFTDFTTCPVPIPQNRLRVAIEAGEQIPLESVAPAQ